MSYASQESIAVTLTQAELAAPFLEVEPDADPLPLTTRAPVLWDGQDWTEIDVATGQRIGGGCQ